jgi:HK97 family phage prohead protease
MKALKLINRELITFLFVIGAFMAGSSIKQEYSPAEYEIIGLATSTQYNNRGYKVHPKAFLGDVKMLEDGTTYMPLLANHANETGSVIGKIISLQVTNQGLLFKAKIVDTPENHAIIGKIKRGELVGISVGFRPLQKEGDVITIGDLYEISIVPLGADPGAKILHIGPYVEDE